MKIRLLVITLLTLTMLTACGGFQLRGSQALPSSLSPVMVAGLNQYSDLYRQLQYQLNTNGIKVTRNIGEAASVLRISDARSRDNLVAIDTRGKGVEYLLIERANIELLSSGGDVLVSKRKVAVDHYRYALGTEQLATEREREEKEREMQEELALTIVRTLHYALR